MRPAWRLGINSLSERRSRTALLIATVALSALLIAAVNTAIHSMHQGIKDRVDATVGAADLRLQHVGKKVFDASVMERMEAWPESVSTTRNRLTPDCPVWTYVANVSSLTDTVTGKSAHAPLSKRCTWRMAPSPPG